jgi:signal peptidase I
VRHVVGLTKVTGASMQPVFNPNLHKNPLQKDVLLLDRLSIRLGHLRRGDIVTLW